MVLSKEKPNLRLNFYYKESRMIKYKYVLLSITPALLAVVFLFSLGWVKGTAVAAPVGRGALCEVETNGNNVTDFSSADASALQSAVNAVAPNTLIKVAGTCAGVQTVAGVTQTVYINKGITIQGGHTSTNWLAPSNPATNPTVLDALQGGRVVYILNGNKTVTLDGLTITGGNGAGSNGGGIFAGANVIFDLTNSIVSENSSGFLGGGIYNAAALFTMDNSTLVRNSSTGFGGGLHITGAVIGIINGSEVQDNEGSVGGGLHVDNGATLRIDTTTIEHNNATIDGGGVANDSNTGNIEITNSTIFSNTAGDSGAGIFNNGILTVDNTAVSDNEAFDDGGGLLNHNNGQATITNSTIENNRAKSSLAITSRGAGIYNRATGTVAVMTTTLSLNSAENNGGGIWNEGAFTIESSTLEGNTSNRDGGGIWNLGNLTVTASDILSNSVLMDGGGVHNTGSTTINDSTLAYNEANDGGGIYSTGLVTVTTVSISGSTIHDNQAIGPDAANRGGGVYVNSGPFSIINSTISRNFAEDAGAGLLNNGNVTVIHSTILSNTSILGPITGIYNLGTSAVMNLTNTAIAYNNAAGPGNTDCGGVAGSTIVDNGYNLVQNGTCITAGTSLSGNPLLGSLANNGGNTVTHLPLPFSPVIDRIPAGSCAAANDQRGVTRPVDLACDIGAVELALNYGPPVAVADAYTTTEDIALVVPIAGVLTNDTDPDFGPLTAVMDTNVVSGVLALSSTGSFTYTPNANFCGTDSFTYHANDVAANSNSATVTLNVTCVPDLPIAVNDTYTTAENTLLTVPAPGVLSNDSDGDGDALTAVLDADVMTGTLNFNGDGSFDYTPPVSFSGIVTFTYHVDAGGDSSNIAVVSIAVGDVGDPPVAVNDTYMTNEDTALNVAASGVLGNDSDADGDPLTAVLVTNVTTGSLTFNTNGSFNYTPPANWSGVATFTYRANDGLFNSNTATVTITVNAVNDAPTATADSYNTTEDVALTVNAPGVLDNDSDVEGDNLTAALDTDVTNGTLTLSNNGSFTYTPNANFCGTDSFTYHANDGQANSGSVTVTLNVACAQDAPVAVNDTYATTQDTELVVTAPGILGNDTDVDGDSLTAVLDSGVLTGTLVFNPDGSFTYTPDLSWTGVATFTYHADDGPLNSNTALVTIVVGGDNTPPDAVNDSYNVLENSTDNVLAVLTNDSDIDGDTLSITNVSDPANGTTVISGQTILYTPGTNFLGVDTFTYTISDGTFTDTATVTINVVEEGDLSLYIPFLLISP
jgi:VCBS repeat-containing protein